MGHDHEIRWQAKRDAFLMGIACESERLADSSEPEVIAIAATKLEELSRALRYAAEEVVRERSRIEAASRAADRVSREDVR